MNPEALLLIETDDLAKRMCVVFEQLAHSFKSAKPEVDELVAHWSMLSGVSEEDVYNRVEMLLKNGICDLSTKSLNPLVVNFLRMEVSKHLGLKQPKEKPSPKDSADKPKANSLEAVSGDGKNSDGPA